MSDYTFQLDPFQEEAIQHINAEKSVVVCAPTGSGKTLIAEYAAKKAIESGRKLIYTTPLKALNNQKYHDFVKQYGDEKVGLLTGDTSINRDAQIIIMTTEIFRNMVYGVQEDNTLLNQVKYLILDECHYMNDSQRGTVWEESIIHCPHHIQMIALSATIANAKELTNWINTIHHNTELVLSDFRPVPLRHFFFAVDQSRLFPLFESGSKQLNSQLKRYGSFVHKKRGEKQAIFRPNQLIHQLHDRQMLPAIVFTFSRKGCDKYLADTLGMSLLNELERQRIKKIIDAFVASNPLLAGNRYLPYLLNGFASHHAGHLPALKVLIEYLFQQGLIKAVFATETLAAGINMPARTTVITAVSKRADVGHRMLTASEFLQMSGRAGRRGMDEQGFVVTVSSPYETASEIALLARSSPEALNSQFSPSYGMVINLLDRFSLDESEKLIAKSFGAFTMGRKLAPLHNEKTHILKTLGEQDAFTCPASLSEAVFEDYLKQKELLAAIYRELGTLKKQAKRFGRSPEIQDAISQTQSRRDKQKAVLNGIACETCDVLKEHTRLHDNGAKSSKRLEKIEKLITKESEAYWQEFLKHYQLLKSAGYLETDDKPNTNGLLLGDIKTENEFFLTEVILSHCLDNLSPPALAGVISAIINDDRKDRIVNSMPISQQCDDALKAIRQLAKKYDHLQHQFHIHNPIKINPASVPLVEHWTQGVEWHSLIEASNFDEGDLVRQLRRIADVLRQLTRARNVPEKLARTAHTALYTLYRAPIVDEEIAANPEQDNTTPVTANSDSPQT